MVIIAREGKLSLYKLPGVVMMNSAYLVRCAFRMRYTCFGRTNMTGNGLAVDDGDVDYITLVMF